MDQPYLEPEVMNPSSKIVFLVDNAMRKIVPTFTLPQTLGNIENFKTFDIPHIFNFTYTYTNTLNRPMYCDVRPSIPDDQLKTPN